MPPSFRLELDWIGDGSRKMVRMVDGERKRCVRVVEEGGMGDSDWGC